MSALWRLTRILYTLLIITDFSLRTQSVHAETWTFGIQVAAFKHSHQAENAVKNLQDQGYSAFFRHEQVTGKEKWYRVYMGPYASKQMAADQARQLKQRGIIPDYYIRPIANIPITGGEEKLADRKIEGAEKLQSPADKSSQSVEQEPEQGVEAPLVIRDVKLHSQDDLKETVTISSNRFFEPSVFALEKDKLRFVVDIKNIASVKKGLSTIPVNGKWIKQIRTHHHRGTHTFRVVLDLYPARNYEITQAFFKKENMYAIIVGAEGLKDTPTHPPAGENVFEPPPSNEKMERRGRQFREKAKDLSHEEIKEMLMVNHFYASCWNNNRDFCNPEGAFDNLLFDNGDGTVTDQSTGLMWQKGGTQDVLTWVEAGAYAQSMNRERLVGYTDWRLPTVEELATLMENIWKNGDLYIDPIFEKCQRYCWSSDTIGEEKAWKANYNLGYFMDFPIDTKNWVRLVRSIH